MKSNFYLRLKNVLLPILFLLLMAMSICGMAQTVTTNKADYMPGETVEITGTSWTPGETVYLLIEHLVYTTHPDQTFSTIADGSGNISDVSYIIDAWDFGESFRLTANGEISKFTAITTFTDAGSNPSANLDQFSNDKYSAYSGTPLLEWINGNLGPQGSHYAETMSIPYRMVMDNLSIGTHILIIEWDILKGGKHALDYITSYSNIDNPVGSHLATFGHLPETIDPLLGLSGTFSAPNIFPIPVPSSAGSLVSGQPTSSFSALPTALQYMTIYNGTITALAYVSQGNLSSTGDESTRLSITFTAASPNVLIAWGGHIAGEADWGLGQGATGISGSPYHTRLIDLDDSGGNQDRSLQASAVVIPPRVELNAEGAGPLLACPETNSLVYTGTILNPNSDPVNYTWELLNNTAGAAISGSPSGTIAANVSVVPSLTIVPSGTDFIPGGTFNLKLTVVRDISTDVAYLGGDVAPGLNVVISNLAATISVTKQLSFFGASDAEIGLTVTGDGPFTYEWTASAGGSIPAGMSDDEDLTGLVAGTYSVVVTDINGCKAHKEATIESPLGANIRLVPTDITCFNDNGYSADGAVDLTVSGGSPYRTYSWTTTDGTIPSGQANNEDLTGINDPGTYTVEVKFYNNSNHDIVVQTETESAEVKAPLQQLHASASPTQPLCFGQTGSINLTVSGGTPFVVPPALAPYTYAWTKDGVAFSTDKNLSGLAAGTYTVVVTDANGCTGNASTTINAAPTAISASATPTQPLCSGQTGSISLTVSGGTPFAAPAAPYTYAWIKNGVAFSTDKNLSGLAAGTYTVVVTDANGCTGNASTTINAAPTAINASATPTQPLCSGQTGSISLTVSGGTPFAGPAAPYNYAWIKNGVAFSTDKNLSGLTAGTYTVVVTDANGCTGSASATINAAPSAISASATPTQPSCSGQTGSIVLTVSGGTPFAAPAAPYTYAWIKNGVAFSTDKNLSGLTAGTYTVAVTDANGCTGNASATINAAPTAINASATPTQPLCYGQTGSISLTVSGGTPFAAPAAPYTYAWTKNGVAFSTDKNLSGLAAGTYTVVVTDANGCTGNASAIIVPTTQIVVSITAYKDCTKGLAGLPSGTIRVTGSGYATLQLWSAGANGAIGGGDDVQIGSSVTTSTSPYNFENVYSGSYFVIALAPNTAGTGSCDATSNVGIVDRCYWFNIVKKTQGIVDPSRNWLFGMYQGPDGFGKTSVATASTLNDLDGILDFGNVNLDPTKTYTICEEQMAAGWTAIWVTDKNGTSTVLTTYNPNADDATPSDVGNRCFDIGANTAYPLYPNGVFTININNTYPGGTARTPGYWKNWNTCSGGGQAANAARNGGWQAGYWLLNDVLNSPGVTLGTYTVTTCPIGVSILDQRDRVTGAKNASDAAYTLAMHLMAFKLNQAAGAYGCPYAIDAATKADALLTGLGYNATGTYLKSTKDKRYAYALQLAKILDDYNNNRLSGADCAKTAPVLKSAEIGAVISPASTDESTFKAYPNPFSDKLNIEFSSTSDTQAKLEIYSITGVRLATLFNAEIIANELYTVEYEPLNIVSGILIYRLTLDGKVQTGRVVYEK